MTNSTKRILSTIILLTVICFAVKAQTNVSGGIYSNTTWTKVNSPYIVTDTVVVFPGVTLTIEAGVTVKFDDHQYLEIRQAALIAVGTNIDSITFTSNSLTPIPGTWNEINLNGGTMTSQFSYCNFKYATNGIIAYVDTAKINIKHSVFIDNEFGIKSYANINIDSCNFYNNTISSIGGDGLDSINACIFMYNQIACGGPIGAASIMNCIVDSNVIGLWVNAYVVNCIIKYNQTGITGDNGYDLENSVIDSNYVVGVVAMGDCASTTVTKCEIKYNGIGVDNNISPNTIFENVIEYNNIGIYQEAQANQDGVYCNKICNNVAYDFKSGLSSNFNISNNYWCSSDSATIASHIYDGHDNISLGLITFEPIDTVGCYLTGCDLQLSSNVTNATCDTCHNGQATVNISNGHPNYTYTWYTSPIQYTQTATGLASGTYSVCVADGNGCTACGSVFVDSSNCIGFAVSAHGTNATCISCPDGMAWVNVINGTPPYTYYWIPSISSQVLDSNLAPGHYQICARDVNGCIACDTVTIRTGSCSAHFDLYPDTIALHQYFAVNKASGAGTLSYDWNWGDGSADDNTPFPSHTYSTAGFYNICLTITDTAGCTDTYCNSFYLMRTTNTMIHVNVVSSLITGIHESADNASPYIFPNPASDNLTLIMPDNVSKGTFKIFNLLGELKYSSIVTKQTTIDVSQFAKTVYIIEVSYNDVIARQKFIRQ